MNIAPIARRSSSLPRSMQSKSTSWTSRGVAKVQVGVRDRWGSAGGGQLMVASAEIRVDDESRPDDIQGVVRASPHVEEVTVAGRRIAAEVHTESGQVVSSIEDEDEPPPR